MVMSMTGYGRSIMHIDDSDITVEIRSVNNRFADISVKMPRSLSYCEDKVKTAEESQQGKDRRIHLIPEASGRTGRDRAEHLSSQRLLRSAQEDRF